MKKAIVICLTFVFVLLLAPQKLSASNGNPYVQSYYDDNGVYHPGNCTYQCWEEAYNRLGVRLPGWGNAGTWANSARRAGYTVVDYPNPQSNVPPNNCIIEWNGHVGWCISADTVGVNIREGNIRINGSWKAVHEQWWSWSTLKSQRGAPKAYIILAPPANDPQGCIDNIQGGEGSVVVGGWAFDKDDITNCIDVEVYIGGNWSNGGEYHKINANVSRPDVDNYYHCGEFHGFSANIETDRTGNQTVYIYALNRGGGNNVELGHRDVYITPRPAKDTEKPVISNIKVTNVSQAGYTVTCTATDNVGVTRVQFPTWTEKNGQDDIDGNWWSSQKSSGKKSGNIYSFNVKTSDHKNETGTYITHIYAFDEAGNYVCCDNAVKVTIPINVTGVSISGNSCLKVGETGRFTVAVSPKDATNKEVTWCSSDSSVATIDCNGTVKALKVGETTITCKAKDNGITASTILKVYTDSPIREEETEKKPDDTISNMIENDEVQTMYRLYNPNSGEHLYTMDINERDYLWGIGWNYEDVAWKAPCKSSLPVYRVYNSNSGEHHYTSDTGEVSVLVSLGWNDEGIKFYSDNNRGTPMYRLYNPNATGQYEAGAHHYTKDAVERDYLISIGWRDEGIGWYGL